MVVMYGASGVAACAARRPCLRAESAASRSRCDGESLDFSASSVSPRSSRVLSISASISSGLRWEPGPAEPAFVESGCRVFIVPYSSQQSFRDPTLTGPSREHTRNMFPDELGEHFPFERPEPGCTRLLFKNCRVYPKPRRSLTCRYLCEG